MRGKGRKWETGEEREESIAGGLDKNQGRVLLQQLCAAIAKSLVPCFPKHECMTTLIMRTETDGSGTTYAQVIFPDVHVNEEVHKAARGHVLEDVASQQVAQDLLKVHPSNSLDAVVKPLSDAVTMPLCAPGDDGQRALMGLALAKVSSSAVQALPAPGETWQWIPLSKKRRDGSGNVDPFELPGRARRAQHASGPGGSGKGGGKGGKHNLTGYASGD